jgi:putative endopeptidase
MSCEYVKGKKAESTYNKITTKEALQKYGFDWAKFSKSMGFSYTPEFFITSNLNYLKCGTELLLKEWNSERWRTYWIYIFIRQLNRWNQKGRELMFEYHGNFVKGQEEIVKKELAPVFSLGFAFNTFLTNEYIDKYQNDQLINYVKTMAEDLKAVFIRIIKRNKWLQPQTKEKALKKLYNFNLEVGSPKLLRDDPILNYSSDDAWGNILKITDWRHEKAVKLEGKPVIDIPVIDWAQVPPKFIGTQAYVVNASYTPSKNGIYIPLGYIQKPFVDLEERGIEHNLAHIGFTLGHEMSHALDDWGSKYDETGKLNDWWTEKDKKKFKRIQKDVIKQYEVFASYDGIKFDAEPSIGEDIADISGLAICREYLRDFQLKNEDILPIKALSFEAFFVYFAYQQRQKISKKAIEAQLKTNPHPLDKYRTNVPLSRIPVFREIYKVKKGDKMWWHSTNRVWDD